MKRSIALVAAITLLPAAASANPTRVVTRQLHTRVTAAIQSSADIEPVARADADVKATDDGTTLTITGHADGFVPNLAYLSLIYDNGSTAYGPAACLPTPGFPVPVNPGPQMFVGYWLPATATHRYLYVQKTGAAYVPLGNIGTISIRYDSQPNNPTPASDATQQNPGRLYLQSCGKL